MRNHERGGAHASDAGAAKHLDMLAPLRRNASGRGHGMTALARIDLSRLAKLCGMFSSDHMGERAAAAKKADELVRAAKLTWPDILHAERPDTRKFQSSRRRAVLTPGELLARHGAQLTGWERGFLTGLIRRPFRMTARQTEILNEIRAKCAAGAA